MPSLVNLTSQRISLCRGLRSRSNTLNDISRAAVAIGQWVNGVGRASWLIIDTPNVESLVAGEKCLGDMSAIPLSMRR